MFYGLQLGLYSFSVSIIFKKSPQSSRKHPSANTKITGLLYIEHDELLSKLTFSLIRPTNTSHSRLLISEKIN